MLLLAIVALEVPLALNIRQRVDDEVRSQARAQADVVAATAAELVAHAQRSRLATVVTEAGRAVRGRVVVVDRAGRLLADSGGTPLGGVSYRGRPEVAVALGGRADQRARDSQTLGKRVLATAVPIRHGTGPPIGVVRVTQSVDAVNRAMRRTVLELVLVGGVVLAMGLGAGLLMAAGIARPLHRLGEAAGRVAEGDLTTRALVEGSSEQRSLARTFNEMTQRVARLVRSRQDFVADASHQLRTPLTGVRLRLEEARLATTDPRVASDLDAGIDELDRLARIVDELLVLSRAGERELPGEIVDLGGAAERAAERWAVTAAERDQEIEVGGGEGIAWCAPADLDRVLDVLVDNALRYSPPSGSVRIEVEEGAIEVLDRGPGVEPGEEEAVFERFHRGTAGRGRPGTGLGLAIARELAGEWDATVAITRRVGGGARATVRFPLQPPVVRPDAAALGRAS